MRDEPTEVPKPRPDRATPATNSALAVVLWTPPLALAFGTQAFLWLAVVCLLLAFLFSLFEGALQHFSSVRLMESARKRGLEERIGSALEREDETLICARIGRGLFQLLGVAFLAVWLVQRNPSDATVAAVAVLGSLVFLLFFVAAPNLVGRRAGDRVLLRGLIPFQYVATPLRPLARVLQGIAGRLFAKGEDRDPAEELQDDILSAVEEGGREGLLDDAERQMIEGVFDLREVTADHVMTPRTDMVSTPLDSALPEAIERAVEKGLSRLPVHRETPDDIVGVLYIKDLLRYLVDRSSLPTVEEAIRPAFFVPESKNVGELLREMQARHVHMAVVVDEYGGTAGVVTIEDILEEIVGEIEDEHESEQEQEVVEVGDGEATVQARTHIDDLNRILHIDIPESDEYETVGGLLFTRMGRVPAQGESYDLEGVRFTVLDADARRVQRVRVSTNGARNGAGPSGQ